MDTGRLRERNTRDLAAGRVLPAINRLRTHLRDEPTDLAARSALGHIYRDMGNAAEAGRWLFTTDEATPRELEAFAKRSGAVENQLLAIGWRGAPRHLLTDSVAQRLTALHVEAERRAKRGLAWGEYDRQHPWSADPDETWRDNIGCIIAAAAIGIVLFALAIGLITIGAVVGDLLGLWSLGQP